ncbi:MAG: voltage-gated potassium channel [Clostridia bacterium]|nr:voltage-gated potassium channel [Clostridia bacterium]
MKKLDLFFISAYTFCLGIVAVFLLNSQRSYSFICLSVVILLILAFSFFLFKNFPGLVKLSKQIKNLNMLKEFIILVILCYLLIVAIFGAIYYLIAVNTIAEDSYFKWFYFSSITLATVGYGDISPVNEVMQLIVIIESFIGYISFPIIVSIGLSLIFRE